MGRRWVGRRGWTRSGWRLRFSLPFLAAPALAVTPHPQPQQKRPQGDVSRVTATCSRMKHAVATVQVLPVPALGTAGIPQQAVGPLLFPYAAASQRAAVLLVNSEAQTEASFIPGSSVRIEEHYDALASEQLSQLLQFRQHIHASLLELAGTTYDIAAYKDVLLKMEEQLQARLPVTDILLLSSKLFRHTSELSRQLHCFLDVVFAEDYVDEHFHFTELRVVLKELAQTKEMLSSAEKERDRLQALLDEIAGISMNQGKTVELLEKRNNVLQLHSTALKDQMALLFHQVAAKMEGQNVKQHEDVDFQIEMNDEFDSVRSAFSQTMDSLAQNLRSSRLLIAEVRESLAARGVNSKATPDGGDIGAVGSGASKQRGGAEKSDGSGGASRAKKGDSSSNINDIPHVRFKLKMLDSNLQQLVGRFLAVKDQMASSAQELQAAVTERKRSLYLSLQHIRMYELQNANLRQSRALMQEMQRHFQLLMSRLEETFVNHDTTHIDPQGHIFWAMAQQGSTWRPEESTDSSSTLMNINERKSQVVHAASNDEDEHLLRLSLSSRRPSRKEGAVMGPTGNIRNSTTVQNMSSGSRDTFLSPDNLNTRNQSREHSIRASPTHQNERSLKSRQSELRPVPIPSGGSANRIAQINVQRARKGIKPLPILTDTTKDAQQIIPFATVRELMKSISNVNGLLEKLQSSYDVQNEQYALLQVISLAAASTDRTDVAQDTLLRELSDAPLERALLPTGNFSHQRQSSARSSCSFTSDAQNGMPLPGVSTVVVGPGNQPAGTDAAIVPEQVLLEHQQQMQRMHEEFATKLGLLRQVYEARIADLEIKESAFKRRLEEMRATTAAIRSPGSKGTSPSTGKAGSAARGRKAGPGKPKEKKQGRFPSVNSDRSDSVPLSRREDQYALLDARVNREYSASGAESEQEKLSRLAAAKAINSMDPLLSPTNLQGDVAPPESEWESY